MPFKINISDKGKTYKVETENESLVGKRIGETISGEDISSDLKGYEIEITGTSDLSGIPGFKGLEGANYHRRLLKFGPGMKNKRKGVRLRKTNRGEEISLKTIQINAILLKQGTKKFEDLLNPKEETEASPEEKPAEEKPAEKPQEKPAEKPAEDKKEKPAEEKKEEVKKE